MTSRAAKTTAENEAVWVTALRLGRFSYASLSAETHVRIDRVEDLVKGWVKARLVEAEPKRESARKIFVPTKAAREMTLPPNLIELPPETGVQENLWRSARLLGSFGARDLAVHSTTTHVEVSEEAAARFCQVLLRGGYLKVIRKASFKRGKRALIKTPAIYRLVRNTGPMPPVERRVAAIYDPNLGEYTYIAGAAA